MNFALKAHSVSEILEYFSFPFVRYALIVSVLISLCAALLGVNLVLKRYSMIGDGLSHIAFGAGAVSAVVGVAGMAISLPITVATAVVLLKSKSKKKIMGDSAIAMLSAGSLAIGYLLLNITEAGSSNLSGDVCSSLFGSTSILALKKSDVIMALALAVGVILVFVLLYNKLFAVTFDERFSIATGVKADVYNLLMAIISAVVIVIGMKLVGALLISSLIIFPALSAMRIAKSYRGVIITSAALSIVCSLVGIFGSLWLETPVGAGIVAINIAAFGICSLVGYIRRRVGAR